jgi:ribosomal protein S18 acetylase RimI-like enzyme
MTEAVADLSLVPRRRRDSEFLFQLSEELFAPYARYPRTVMASMLAEPGAVTRIAEIRPTGSQGQEPRRTDRRAGFFILQLRPLGRPFGPWPSPATGYLAAIGVRADARGRGVGRFLLEGAEKAAREGGAVCMSLMTAETNARARRLFSAAGYTPLFTQEGAYAGGRNGIVFFRALVAG